MIVASALSTLATHLDDGYLELKAVL